VRGESLPRAATRLVTDSQDPIVRARSFQIFVHRLRPSGSANRRSIPATAKAPKRRSNQNTNVCTMRQISARKASTMAVVRGSRSAVSCVKQATP
jgi:hypothetical protein